MVDVMITVDENLCKGCNICTEFCPRKVYRESGLLNKKGVHVPVPENEDKCTQCQLCAMMCPDQAIRVDEKVDEKDEN
jgi:2-oxoglutarate ferredoxin oxidoreductase subunit delta